MSRIGLVVTGGAGFIGANLVRELNRRGRSDILLVDCLRTGDKWKNLRALAFEDVLDKRRFLAGFRRDRFPDVETIFHMGACSSTTETDADYLLHNNYRYTRRLCQEALQRQVRFVYASSAATYGDGSRGYSDADEMTPTLMPLNMYGFSKHLFDLWALRNGLFDRIAGLKFFNVYGPGEAHKAEMRSVVHKAFEQIRDTGRVRLFKSYRQEYADGEQVRDFVYVRDAVAMTLFFHEHPEVSGLFNAGTGRARSWNDLARAVFQAMRIEPDIEYIDMPGDLREKYQYHTQADMRRARAAGCPVDCTSLEEGVEDYVRYMLGGE